MSQIKERAAHRVLTTAEKRPRLNLGRLEGAVPVPNLVQLQIDSYQSFMQLGVPHDQLKDQGMHSALSSIFPLSSPSGHVRIEYAGYTLGEMIFSAHECKVRGTTSGVTVRARVRICLYDKDSSGKYTKVKEIKEQEIYMGELPLMTSTGSFIINGTERVVVSQLHRSPGVFFEHDKGRTQVHTKKLLYSARIIPYRGAWLDFEFDAKNIIYARIDRRRKIYSTVILKALGYTDQGILDLFYEVDHINIVDGKCFLDLKADRLKGEMTTQDIFTESGELIIQSGRRVSQRHVNLMKKNGMTVLEVSKEFLFGKIIAKSVINPITGDVECAVNTLVDDAVINNMIELGIKSFNVLYTNDLDRGTYIADTLRMDPTASKYEAMIEIYKVIRPGEPATDESAQALFHSLFFDPDRYDLSQVGRMKLRRTLKVESTHDLTVLTPEDIVAVLKSLVEIRDGRGFVDDIDSLANRRVRCVGEMVENQLRTGLARVERTAKDRLSHPDAETAMPQDILNTKPVIAAIREFFSSSQLSQFMEQNNPLSEVTHKRRISALGPGGLTRDRAGFEVRDVHHTHYGRLCPIETPEGPNIGLINSLAIYAKLNEYGFIESPYRRVQDGKVSSDIVYISAIEEGTYKIAQASLDISDDGMIQEEFVACRYKQEFSLMDTKLLNFIDVSPWQIVSVAASLIPFLEHNDANRALMGSNMQRQAVPLVRPDKPLVGTGMERVVASDSGVSNVARRAGVVQSVSSDRIVVKVETDDDVDVDVYNLTKFARSNQNTCINMRPVVNEGDLVDTSTVLADGPSTDMGELALGQNVLVAFLSWNGYNFEDSIIVSERVESFTSIHIQEFQCISRDTKLGSEEITADIPNLSESALSKLDESGIIYIGAEVEPGDILVGKVTPKGETQLSPEEKLLRAIFGEKASDVKDTSLRVPAGFYGTVTGMQIFTRDGVEKDQRTLRIEQDLVDRMRQDLYEPIGHRCKMMQDKLVNILKDQIVKSSKYFPARVALTEEILRKAKLVDILSTVMVDESLNKHIEHYSRVLADIEKKFQEDVSSKEKQIRSGDELSPGVIKIVKIFLACKRKIQSGDKMAGRHGNKGVVSVVVPVEDMPCLDDGTPIDIILNPLGVPSRMNVGQVLEVHLGWAAKALGRQIGVLLDRGNFDGLRAKLNEIYALQPRLKTDFNLYTDEQIVEIASSLRNGIPMASPVFDGAGEERIRSMLKLAGLPETGQAYLMDGRTGEKFDNPVTVGYMYMFKLNHLVDDKMHARSTGSYSLVTQQPLGGKAQFGGQRLGEMEVWALQAYGAAYTLQEMLTVKSDDVQGRTRMYKNIVDGNYRLESSIPESFNVLTKEMMALGINVLVSDENK